MGMEVLMIESVKVRRTPEEDEVAIVVRFDGDGLLIVKLTGTGPIGVWNSWYRRLLALLGWRPRMLQVEYTPPGVPRTIAGTESIRYWNM
jgi:hypothetical protein